MIVGESFELSFGGVKHYCLVMRTASFGSTAPVIERLSMRDARWRGKKLGQSNYTIGNMGCALTCAAMVAGTTPDSMNDLLVQNGGFSGACLKWEAVPPLYPQLEYAGPADRSRDGPLVWMRVAADLQRIRSELAIAPSIMEVDFRPGGAFDMHFVLALALEGDDVRIIDPWDGVETKLLARYATTGSNLGRSIYGLRLLRMKGA